MAKIFVTEGAPLLATRAIDSILGESTNPYEIWSLQHLRGRALEKAGKIADVIAAYEEAESALDDIASLVPFGEGRASALSSRRESSRALVALHLARGDGSEALDVARRARARVLSSFALSGRMRSLDPTLRKMVEDAIPRSRARGRRTCLRQGATSRADRPHALARRNGAPAEPPRRVRRRGHLVRGSTCTCRRW